MLDVVLEGNIGGERDCRDRLIGNKDLNTRGPTVHGCPPTSEAEIPRTMCAVTFISNIVFTVIENQVKFPFRRDFFLH